MTAVAHCTQAHVWPGLVMVEQGGGRGQKGQKHSQPGLGETSKTEHDDVGAAHSLQGGKPETLVPCKSDAPSVNHGYGSTSRDGQHQHEERQTQQHQQSEGSQAGPPHVSRQGSASRAGADVDDLDALERLMEQMAGEVPLKACLWYQYRLNRYTLACLAYSIDAGTVPPFVDGLCLLPCKSVGLIKGRRRSSCARLQACTSGAAVNAHLHSCWSRKEHVSHKLYAREGILAYTAFKSMSAQSYHFTRFGQLSCFLHRESQHLRSHSHSQCFRACHKNLLPTCMQLPSSGLTSSQMSSGGHKLQRWP